MHFDMKSVDFFTIKIKKKLFMILNLVFGYIWKTKNLKKKKKEILTEKSDPNRVLFDLNLFKKKKKIYFRFIFCFVLFCYVFVFYLTKLKEKNKISISRKNTNRPK